MINNFIYDILSSKPHNTYQLLRYIKFIGQCKVKPGEYYEIHHICPKANDMFPEYEDLSMNSWNGIKLTARQHIIAHIMLWKIYGDRSSQLTAVHYFLNVQNDKFIKWNNRSIPSSLLIRYASKARETFYANRVGFASWYTKSGSFAGFLHRNDSRIKLEDLVGPRYGSKHSIEDINKIKRGKDKNRKIKLWFLSMKIIVPWHDPKVPELIEQGWRPYKIEKDVRFMQHKTRTAKLIVLLSGRKEYVNKDGTLFGRLSKDDPRIKEHGLIQKSYRTEKQTKQAKEQALSMRYDESVQRKKSISMKQKLWFNNPVTKENKRMIECPDGWVSGRYKNAESIRKSWWNDGTCNFYIDETEKPNEGWVRGMIPRSK